MDDRYGGAPEFASADPAIAPDRVAGTIPVDVPELAGHRARAILDA
ncbi:hypothetical protein ACH3VR_08855 [Microbacterium sp. B2969]|uniref:Uncharacterized protein n=1 Tax=Microbacterium alkaliflavum TaxID=3248839 RepID=A0ABW7Q7K1_9MICO